MSECGFCESQRGGGQKTLSEIICICTKTRIQNKNMTIYKKKNNNMHNKLELRFQNTYIYIEET